MVNNADIARAAVASAKYPPVGKRGFGFCRANYYGAEFEDYVGRWNDDVLVIVQIEHIDAVNNIDDILSVDGVDGAFIGPYDLSGSMNLTGQLDHPKVQKAIAATLKACKKHNKAAGIHVVAIEPEQVRQRIEEGFTLIAMSLDAVMLRDACQRMLSYR